MNQNPLSDTALIIITVIPDNHCFFRSKRTTNSDGDEVLSKVVSVNDGKIIGISNSYKEDVYFLAHEMGNLLGLQHKSNQKCCRFEDSYSEIFQLSESVSNLAMNTSGLNSKNRKFTEIENTNSTFVATAKR